MTASPGWVEAVVAALLLASGLMSLVAALGLLRLKDFFQRMHAPALANTFGTWCVALASIVYFSALELRPALHAWLIVILLSITAPITTTLIARAALFRKRGSSRNARETLVLERDEAGNPAPFDGEEASTGSDATRPSTRPKPAPTGPAES